MKSNLYLFIVFLIPVITISQNSKDKTIFLDSSFVQTKEQNYKYYMIVKDYEKKKGDYFITRYYTTGKIQSKGFSESRDYFREKGEIISYYENENIKSTLFYKDNHLVGNANFGMKTELKNLKANIFYQLKRMEQKLTT